MKKQNQLLIVLLLAFSTTVFSQRLSFGVRGGLNVANLSIELPDNLWPADNQKQPRISFNAGVYGQYSLNEKMALRSELFYSGEGAQFTDPGTELPARLHFSYLSLPLFFRYNLIKNFYAMAGPQFSYLLSAQATYKDEQSYDVSNEHNKLNVSLVPVLGYDWKDFSLQVRYQMGISKLPNENSYWGHSRYVDNQVKSQVFSVVVCYKIVGLK
jgi:hypothetical protein